MVSEERMKLTRDILAIEREIEGQKSLVDYMQVEPVGISKAPFAYSLLIIFTLQLHIASRESYRGMKKES